MRLRILAIALTTVISILNPSGVVMGQCRSVTGGTWRSYYNGGPGLETYTLSQNVTTGAISGYMHHPRCQTQNWPVVSGQPTAYGSFTIDIINPTPSDPVCIASWVTVDINLNLIGCHNGVASWVNDLTSSSEQEIEYTLGKPCDVPNGESISPSAWGTEYPERTIHGWVQILTAFNPEVNFGGRTVIEEFPSNGTDECHFEGSGIIRQTRPVAGAWSVGFVDGIPDSTFNIWGRDYVGWHEDAVNYYQIERLTRGLPLPCYFTVMQRMTINCDPVPIQYKTGMLSMGIDVNSVDSSRHGQSTSRIWP